MGANTRFPTSCLVFLIAIAFAGEGIGDDGKQPNSPDRVKVLDILKQATTLNEDFKRDVGRIPSEEVSAKRTELENYSEEVLSPAILECEELLKSADDNELASAFLRMVVSFENSADEGLSFSLGRIFLHNADVIMEAFKGFNQHEQEVAYRSLQWGWLNTVWNEDVSDEVILASIKHLRKLSREVSTASSGAGSPKNEKDSASESHREEASRDK